MLVQSVADEIGLNVVEIEAYDIIGDTSAHIDGSLLAAAEKVKASSPSILLIKHIEALAKKADSGPSGRPPAVVKTLQDVLSALRGASAETEWPCVLVGTTSDVDAAPGEVLGCFKQEIEISVGHLLFTTLDIDLRPPLKLNV